MSDHLPRIDGYSGLREIGSGGFSRVYEAHQHEFGRQVAIKALNSRLVDDASVAAFERECRSMGVLSTHPYIVTVFASAFTSDKRPCIVMDLFPAGDYMSSLRSRGPVPLAELLSLGVRMSGALATAHEHGVIHGDVKPQNIFKSNFGYPALGDFGIATLYGPKSDHAPAGLSAHYAAPELIDDGAATTGPAADQYSLAATIFTLATGRRPFESKVKETPQQVILRALSEPTPRLPGRFPRALGDALLRAMARHPQQRFPDLATLGATLAEVERELGYQVTRLPLGGVEDEAPVVASPFLDHAPAMTPASRTATTQVAGSWPRVPAAQDATESVTILRRLPPPTGEPEAEQEASHRPEPGRRRVLLAAGGVVAAVAAAGVGLVALGSGGGAPTSTTSTVPETSGGFADDRFFTVVHDVTGLTGTLESGTATFRWDAPDTEGVAYVVLREDSAGRGASRTVNEPLAVYDDLAEGERPCVRVEVVHQQSGAMSTPGVAACAEDAPSP